ncbi:alpha/beta fold hydrolase [Jatrophihabitans sp. YIM 134969]
MSAPRIEHEDVPLDRYHLHLRRMRPVDTPHAPTMVLMHGIIDSSVSWEPVMPAFAEYADVIAPDLMGHGRSAKPRTDYSVGAHTNHLRDLLDARGHDRIVLVGHSLGGGVAMAFQYQYPGRCDALVLVAAGGLGRRISPWLRLASLPGVVPAMGLATTRPVVGSIAAVRRRALHQGADRRAWVLANAGRVLTDLGQPGARDAFKNTLRGVIDHTGQRNIALGKLHLAQEIPTLFVWGADDPIIPVDHAYRAAELAHGEVAVIEGAGHAPHRSHPERFAEIVTEFLRRHEVV